MEKVGVFSGLIDFHFGNNAELSANAEKPIFVLYENREYNFFPHNIKFVFL